MTDSPTAGPRPIRRALLSVNDKTGLVPFAHGLAAHGVALISTGNTARTIAEAGLPVTEVADVTGIPEMLDGRVKTLHPAIHGGLLARRDRPDHLATLAEHGIGEIDIGDPPLTPASTKNPEFVTVVTNPADYDVVLGEMMAAGGATSLALRRRLARKAYALTAAYDAAIARFFEQDEGIEFPEKLVGVAELVEVTRYGENPHQKAAFYRNEEQRLGVATARQLQGKELSYNNYADTDAAFELVAEFAEPAVAIIKHANPCGVALGRGLQDAWDRALAWDPISAFGGIVAVNRPLDAATAMAINEIFVEVVIAPEAEPAACEILAQKRLGRVLGSGGMAHPQAEGWMVHSLSGGLLVQQHDRVTATRGMLKVVTKRAPSDSEIV